MTKPTKTTIDKKVEKKVKQIESDLKKSAKSEVRKVKSEVKQVAQERDHLQVLLNQVIANQTSSNWKEWINIVCWIICLGMLVVEGLK